MPKSKSPASGKVKVTKIAKLPSWGLMNIPFRGKPWLVECFWYRASAEKEQEKYPHLSVVRLTGTVSYTVAK